MTKDELELHIGEYVRFDIAIIPPPWKTPTMNCNNHFEGILSKNNGKLSHFAIGDCAIRDDMLSLIINFEAKGNKNDA